MSRNNGTTRDVWLRMLADGGRSATANEIAEEMSIRAMAVAQSLCRMAAGGMAKRYKMGRRNVVFGVTADCKVPKGITIAELAQVGVLKKEAA
jgi:predicted ArsR family transcriptional regulator